MSDKLKNIAFYLKSVRVKAGLSQGQLADKCGFNKNTISRTERALRWPGTELVISWLDACGVNYLDVFRRY